MQIIPVDTLVSIKVQKGITPARKYYGYVRKVEVTDIVTYFVSFHPNDNYRAYLESELTVEYGLGD